MHTTIRCAKQVAHCAFMAERLIAARVRNDRAEWLRIREDLAGNTEYEQLAFYLICHAIDDVPESPVGLSGMTWWNVVAIGFTDRPGIETVSNLADGAQLLAHREAAGPWNEAWAAAEDEALWILVHMVELAFSHACGDAPRAMRSLRTSITGVRAPRWRRRLRHGCAYYRRLPARLRCQYQIDVATTGQRPPLWSYLRQLRRNRAHDDPEIPEFRGGIAIHR